MFDLSMFQWLIAVICALFIGFTKTGVPGLGILAIPLMTEVVSARASTGVILPMLIFGDIFAVAYYRRHAVWSHIVRLMPWAASGVVLGYLAMGSISDAQLKPLIGVIVLAMLGINYWWNSRKKAEASVPTGRLFAAGMGIAAGVTTMMANAAGPILTIYLLAMQLPKTEFIGTGAWYYLILNWFKVPFSFSLGLITAETLQLNLLLFPAVAAGALAGIKILKHIPEKGFSTLVQVLTAAAAIKLLFY
jgi:hypothetical protein